MAGIISTKEADHLDSVKALALDTVTMIDNWKPYSESLGGLVKALVETHNMIKGELDQLPDD